MNAYELADELDKINDIPIETIINMLRQQADRIAELEEILDACQRQRDAWRNFAELFDKAILKKARKKWMYTSELMY